MIFKQKTNKTLRTDHNKMINKIKNKRTSKIKKTIYRNVCQECRAMIEKKKMMKNSFKILCKNVKKLWIMRELRKLKIP